MTDPVLKGFGIAVDRWATIDATWAPVLRYKAHTKAEAEEIAKWMQKLIDMLAMQFGVLVRRPPSVTQDMEFETGDIWWYASCRFSVIADQKHLGIIKV